MVSYIDWESRQELRQEEIKKSARKAKKIIAAISERLDFRKKNIYDKLAIRVYHKLTMFNDPLKERSYRDENRPL